MIESMKICETLEVEGKPISSNPLHRVATAISVRLREGKRQITDGPFAETTEQLGGYHLLDVDNLDEAIAIAGSIPPAKKSTDEIRPLFPLPEVSQVKIDAVSPENSVSRRPMAYLFVQTLAIDDKAFSLICW